MTIHWHFEKSSRPALGDGGHVNTQAGSRGANAIQFGAENNSQFLPRACSPSNLPELSPVFSSDGVALLKRGYVAQALLDVAAFVFGLLFICALAGSVPLAIALMLIAAF